MVKTGLQNAVEKIVTGLILNLGPIPSKETLFCSWKYLYHNFPDRGILPNALRNQDKHKRNVPAPCPEFIDLDPEPFGFDYPTPQFLFFFSFNFFNYNV